MKGSNPCPASQSENLFKRAVQNERGWYPVPPRTKTHNSANADLSGLGQDAKKTTFQPGMLVKLKERLNSQAPRSSSWQGVSRRFKKMTFQAGMYMKTKGADSNNSRSRPLAFRSAPREMKVHPEILLKTKTRCKTALAVVALFVSVGGLVLAADQPPVRLLPNVPVPMRDGTILAADVYLPAPSGRYPVLLERTPYGKAGGKGEALYFAPHGYAVVVEDARGRYDSDGVWYAFKHEPDDGQDTIAWAARQAWSNGKVVTIGDSYNAMVQWLAATRSNPALAGMITGFGPSDLYRTTLYPGGAFKLGMMSWALQTGRHTLLGANDLLDWTELLRHLPVSDDLEHEGFHQPFYDDWIAHPSYDEYWKKIGWVGVPPISTCRYSSTAGGTICFRKVRWKTFWESSAAPARLLVTPRGLFGDRGATASMAP